MSLSKLLLALASLTCNFSTEGKNDIDSWNSFVLSICNEAEWKSVVFVSDRRRDMEKGIIAGMSGCFRSCANIFIPKNGIKDALKSLSVLYNNSGFLNAVVHIRSKNVEIMLKEMSSYPLLWSMTSCWIVKADFPWFLQENITSLLYRELNIAFVVRNSTSGGYTIYIMNCKESVEEIAFTIVHWDKIMRNFTLTFNAPHKHMRNLRGKKFKFALEKHFPFYVPAKAEGADMYLLNTLSENLNFSYEILRPKDGKWGSNINGSWNGMIGMVHKQVVHGALGGMSIVPSRLEAVDFSIAYAFDRTTFVVKTPSEVSRGWVIFRPFTWKVWLAIAAANIIAAICLSSAENITERFVHRYHNTLAAAKFTRLRIPDAMFYIFKSSINQGGYNPYSNSARIFLVCWWLFVITVVSRYSGVLVSFMTNPGSHPPVDTIVDLVRMLKAGKYSCGTIKESADYDLFRTEASEAFRIIHRAMDSSESNFVHHDRDGLEKCRREDYAYIAGQLTTEADIRQKGAFIFSRDSFNFFGYGIAFVKGFWYRREFDEIISRMRYGGLLNEEIRKSISRQQHYVPESNEKRALSMYDLQSPFFILFIGLLSSTLVLIAEVLISFKTKRTNRITPIHPLTRHEKRFNLWSSEVDSRRKSRTNF